VTNINSERFNRAETYGKLREWAERLKKFEGVPELYRDIPSYPDSLKQEYVKASPLEADPAAKEAFLERHLDYLDAVRQQIQRKDPGYLKLQELISKEYSNYPGGAFSVGLDPSRELSLFSELTPGNIRTFRQGLMGPAHEIFGHLRPYLLGIQPARDPVIVQGLRGSYTPNIASPTNEALAQAVNDSLIRYLGRDPRNIGSEQAEKLRTTRFPYHSTAEVGAGGRRGSSLNVNPSQVADIGAAAEAFTNLQREPNDIYTFPATHLQTYIGNPSPEFTAQNPYFSPLVESLRRSNYLSNMDFKDPLNIPEAARSSISRSLLDKYVNPSLSNLREGMRISTPGWEKFTDSPLAVTQGVNPIDESGNLLANKLTDLSEFNPNKQYSSAGLMIFGADPVSSAAYSALQNIQKNPYGTAGGAALTLLNDEVAKALAKDDYKGAGIAAAKDVLGGAAVEAGLKNVATPALQRAAPGVAARVIPAVTTAARYGIPAAVGAGLFSQGRTGSALDILANKASTVVPGLKPQPETDVGRRAGRTISNEARYVINSLLQNRVPYLKGRLF
jgi:hypothetical protein